MPMFTIPVFPISRFNRSPGRPHRPSMFTIPAFLLSRFKRLIELFVTSMAFG